MTDGGLTRRGFLQSTGWLVGGVTVLASTSCRLLPPLPTFGNIEDTDALAWVQMRSDGSVLFFCPRAEMGQGIGTGLTQVVAEELIVGNASVDCVYPRSDQIAPTRMTVGSQSIEQFFLPTARAAAGLRMELQARAATRGGVSLAEVVPTEGGFLLPGGEMLQHSVLIEADEDAVVPLEIDVATPLLSLRPAEQRTSVGRVREPVHIDRLVTGGEIYSRDVQLPGLVFGDVARPPQLGAELLGFDEAAARAIPGVVAVVQGPSSTVGIVAETPMAAAQALEALACRWRELDGQQLDEVQRGLDIDAAIEAETLDHTPIHTGDLAEGRGRAVSHLDARYDTPMVAHACIEPRAGVAHHLDGHCEVWTGSQDPWFVRAHVARALDLSTENVVVHNQRIGGAFGGRVLCQASVEAAWLSAGSGRPVKVQWTRETEMATNYVGPQFSHRIQAGVDVTGAIAYWHHRMVGSPILASSSLVPESLHWAADIPADPGTWRGTDLPYDVPNQRVDFADVRTPMPTGPWRGLGAAPNTFAVECAIDELAGAAGVDPLLFRIRHASSDRLVRVLERVREFAGWDTALEEGVAHGVAAAAYKHVTFVAVVARVLVLDGVPRVAGLWCVQDCGVVVSPDQVTAQIEGNLVWGVSMALHEEFRLAGGTAATRNFDTYPIARNSDVPHIETELIASNLPPSGSGEAAFAPAAAAILNAVSSARGTRLRQLPLRLRAGG